MAMTAFENPKETQVFRMRYIYYVRVYMRKRKREKRRELKEEKKERDYEDGFLRNELMRHGETRERV